MHSPVAQSQGSQCSGEQGTWSNLETDSPTFTPGTSSSDTDVRITCTGDYSSEITDEILTAAFTAIPNALDLNLGRTASGVIGVVVTVTNDQTTLTPRINSITKALALFRGQIVSASTVDGSVVGIGPEDERTAGQTSPLFPKNDWRINNYMDVTANGDGKRAIGVYNESGGGVIFRNFATIVTNGDGYTRPADRNWRTRTAHGIQVSSDGENYSSAPGVISTGDVTVINESGAAITTSGRGARGISASADGTGTVTVSNKGTVTTTAGVYKSEDENEQYPYRRADGIYASSDKGNAIAVNEEGGMVTTRGDGSRAVFAWSGGTGTVATATNYGTIVTSGSDYSENGDIIERTRALSANSESGSSEATNHGSIFVSDGNEVQAVFAWSSFDNEDAEQRAVAENRGTITASDRTLEVIGLTAAGYPSATRNIIEAVNSGDILLAGGKDSNGIGAYTFISPTRRPGTVDSPISISATNSGSITVSGPPLISATSISHFPSGIYAGFYDNDETDSNGYGNTGDVSVENTGTITIKNGYGIITEAYGSGNTRIVVRDGAKIVGGDGSVPRWGQGIHSYANVGTSTDDVNDDDDISIQVSGRGTAITAFSEAADDSSTDIDESTSYGIYAKMKEARTGSDRTARAKVEILDEATVTADVGVAFEGGKGVLNVDNSNVDGDIHFAQGDYDDVLDVSSGNIGKAGGSINFYGGNDNLIIYNGLVRSNLNFGDGDDRLSLQIWGQFNGDLDFGAGNDYLSLDVVDTYGPSIIRGNILGIETIDKICPGTVRILGNVNFEASALNLKEGGLAIAGVVDLNNGVLTIYDDTKLTFEIGDIVADQGNYGRIVNASAVFNQDVENPEISTEIDAALNEQQVTAVRTRLRDSAAAPLTFVDGGFKQNTAQGEQNVDVTVTSTDSSTGTSRKVGTIAQSSNMLSVCDPADANCGDIMVAQAASFRDSVPDAPGPGTDPDPDPDPDPGTGTGTGTGTVTGSSGGGGGGALLGVGLIAILLNSMDSDEFNEESAEFRTGYPKNGNGLHFNDSMLSNSSQFQLHEGDSINYWVRSLTDQDSNAPLGINAIAKAQGTELGMNFDLGNGFKLTGSVIPGLSASDSNATMQGDKIQFGGSWRKGNFYSGLKVSHENHDTELTTKNPVVNSFLKGNSTLSNTYLQLQAGKQSIFNTIRMQAVGSIFAGSMTQGAYTAESPALTANIPEMSHNYSGWKLGLNIAPTKMFEFSNGTRMLPVLKIGTMRTTTSGVQSMLINQSDRAGALGFNTNFGVRNLPTAINTLSLSSKYEVSSNSSWNFGFAGAEIDGEFESVALAKFAMKF